MNSSSICTTAPSKKERAIVYHQPRFSVHRSENETRVQVELPGVAKDDLNVTVENNELLLEGKVSNQRPDSWKALHRESIEGTYRLRLRLGDQADQSAIRADMANGALALTIPKEEAAKPQKIEVK
ncbi:MAG: Hsp20/alpha crystallin family protein [Verrucomicrobia bacterium]|nr:Hsp20/alpha crystallin family protein [Verrucomicrobiota bacterium]